ncbi:gamma-glutamyltranspeptidase / glutathione hydrolase [Aureimonas altamirensis DSM 21988]|uniref:Gamma-glutamyltranspeptidase / glutathione hydrolase n=2 Tax=Aureimonas altamirensis TaxID=370622 RepID=A0ABY1IEJ2_9HYPH|nr:gamma-glutamyltranspeptidase / glutathione hydrolase [Aureimonas altamirensis DSM 21988]
MHTGGEAHSRRGMVTSPDLSASAAGRDVLAAGGTAVEAVVAAGAVLAVTYPHFCGLGGDAVWLLADGKGQRDCLLGIGQAAAELPAYPDGIPPRGPLSAITSACLVDSWDTALAFSRQAWGGTGTLADLLEPAVRLAEDGFPLTASQAWWRDYRAKDITNWPGFLSLFDADRAGMPFRQPQLAKTLRRIQRDGSRDFYEGALAADIARGLQAAGSPLRAADLAATRTRHAEPLSLDYRGTTLLAPPPPTQGVTTLAIMGILSRLDPGALTAGGPDHLHLLVEAVKRAFLDRRGIADPDAVAQRTDEWLSADRLDAHAASIDAGSAMAWPHRFQTGDTVFLAACDAQGRCASVLQSLYFDWGSGVVAGDTGILWQNRGAAFSTDTGDANRLRPGKRPFYTLNPGIGLKDGRPSLLYGTQGADGQPQTLSLVLSNMLDFGLSPAEALAAPRFLLGRTFSDTRDSLKLEVSAGEATIAQLSQRGHEVAPIPAFSPLAGQAGMIQIDGNGAMRGAHDPRSDGAAIGV